MIGIGFAPTAWLSAEEALEEGLIDLIATDIHDLLEQLQRDERLQEMRKSELGQELGKQGQTIADEQQAAAGGSSK